MAGENHSTREQQQIFHGRHGNWRPVVRVLELRTWENFNETTCITNTHTRRYMAETKVTQTTGTKHSSGTLLDWGLCKKKKKKVQQRNLILLAVWVLILRWLYGYLEM